MANNFTVAKGTVVVSGKRIAVEVKEWCPGRPKSAEQARGPRKVGGPLVPEQPICYIGRLLTPGRTAGATHLRSWRNW